ncbi:unnamed protein product [Adineta steineri]|uniref:Coronin n=1 Tax=Adineta steineri TaxID=433720 RepID=A0A813NE52_9BILA|nr:unnamed protein product [Adineta steineri]CAF0748126.1 unnamed protein product [Adineta steineri]
MPSLTIPMTSNINMTNLCKRTLTHNIVTCPSTPSTIEIELKMPFKVRISKFRHVFGTPYREQDCYKNIAITRNAHDGSFCAVNSKFLAIVTETSGGGSFLVILLSEVGRVDVDHPRITGHRGPVVDLKFNPFNDNEIASCSDDGTVKVWYIPNEGLKTDTYQWKVDLHGHQRRVDYIEWHPTAQNLILSAGLDHQVVLWNVERAEPIQVYRCHPDAIQSITWNRNGSLFATTCKDKHIRVIEPRTGRIIAKGIGHQGPKTSKVVFLGDTNRLLSTGFGKQFERQISIWNANDLSKPLTVETVDFSAGALIPFYDHDTHTVYLAGKGDGNIRYYEVSDQGEPYLYFLSEYKSSSPQRCLGIMPKIGLDVTRNEIMRFYKLYATGSVCEPISMIVPRKAEAFQLDIYPDTPGPYPALSSDEWISGIDRDPILVSMKDRIEGTNMPKITTYRTLDSTTSTPVLPHRGTQQRTVQPPIAEVAPTPKQNVNDQSLTSSMSHEKLSINTQQQPPPPPQQSANKGLRKIESLKMPATSVEFNNVSRKEEKKSAVEERRQFSTRRRLGRTSSRGILLNTSDEVLPSPPLLPERKHVSPQPMASPTSKDSKSSSRHSLYKTLRSSFKPFSSPSSKKLSHASSTPDLSSVLSDNKNSKDDDDTSSSIENLSKHYSSLTIPKQRPPGSILKQRSQPPQHPVHVQEEPIYISSACVPLNKPVIQSIIRDQNVNVTERDKFQNQISQHQQQSQTSINNNNNNQNRRNVEVKKKVWSVDAPEQQQQQQQQQMFHHVNGNGHYPSGQQPNGVDYRQAFLKQQEEVQSLRELMLLKDNRIRLLEDELRVLKNQCEHQENEQIR